MAKKLISSDDELVKAMADSGLGFSWNTEEGLKLEHQFIRLQSIRAKVTKRGMYITDPHRVPIELQDKNIVYIDEPIEVIAITQDGKEIEVILTNLQEQLKIEYETIEPTE